MTRGITENKKGHKWGVENSIGGENYKTEIKKKKKGKGVIIALDRGQEPNRAVWVRKTE